MLPKDSNRQILLLKDGGKSFDWNNTKDINRRSTQHFDANKLKEWIKLHIDNLFVVAGGATFKQITGIPMGASAAPMIANLTLFMAEYKYIKMLSSNIQHVGLNTDAGFKQWTLLRQLSYCNRFIDDLLNMCVDRETFNDIALEIYSAIGLRITDGEDFGQT